jgi:eukaryotic-like serine/threonine-protein kinase
MPLIAGTKLDGYEILGLLGAGGMGEVYRARDPALKREVAIKVLPAFVSQDPDRLRRFEQEAQAAAALNHPNILAVYQFGTFEGAPYLVSELLEGSTLRQLLQRGPIPIRKAIDYGIQIEARLRDCSESCIVAWRRIPNSASTLHRIWRLRLKPCRTQAPPRLLRTRRAHTRVGYGPRQQEL